MLGKPGSKTAAHAETMSTPFYLKAGTILEAGTMPSQIYLNAETIPSGKRQHMPGQFYLSTSKILCKKKRGCRFSSDPTGAEGKGNCKGATNTRRAAGPPRGRETHGHPEKSKTKRGHPTKTRLPGGQQKQHASIQHKLAEPSTIAARATSAITRKAD